MVENQWNLCRFPYLDNAIFKPSKIKLIQDVFSDFTNATDLSTKYICHQNIKPDKFSNISNHIVFFFVHYFISVSKSSSCPSGVLFPVFYFPRFLLPIINPIFSFCRFFCLNSLKNISFVYIYLPLSLFLSICK